MKLKYGSSFCLFVTAGIKSRIQTAEYLPDCEAWCWISWIKSRFLTCVFSFKFSIFLICRFLRSSSLGNLRWVVKFCVMAFFSIFKSIRWILDVVTINRISFNHRRTWNPFGKSLEENYLWLVLPGFKTAKILILAVFHEFLWTERRTRKKTSLACYCKSLRENQHDVLPAFWETEGMPYVSGAFGLMQPCRKSTKTRAKPRNDIQKCSVGVILIMLPHILWKLRGCESILRFLPNIDSKWIF